MEKIECTIFKGYTVVVEITPKKDYAKIALKILESARDSHAILSAQICHDGDIMVACLEHERDFTIQWLEQFGKIDSVARVLIYQPKKINYERNKYYGCFISPSYF